jgi:hypothetical protein
MDDTRPFPIQGEHGQHRLDRSTIPWWLAELAYEQYATYFGRQQSLERLAERGGFGRDELVALLAGKNPIGAATTFADKARPPSRWTMGRKMF